MQAITASDLMKPSYLISTVLGVALLYPLSFGPVVWVRNRIGHETALDSFGRDFYYPLVRLSEQNPTTCRLLIRYQSLVD
jgi:hypothetical protein